MKIIAIGDVHGRDCWKQVVATEQFDKLVFIGDYFDSFNIDFTEQAGNFGEIAAYKKAHPDKVILLLGNHDFHYLPGSMQAGESYSGYQSRYAFQISQLIQDNLYLLQMCYQWENYLFTHAGVTHTWLSNAGYEGEAVELFINDLFRYKPGKFFFDGWDPYGNNVTQSPIWVRPPSLKKNAYKYETLRQVVGHTRMPHLEIIKDRFFFIDTMDGSKEYLILEDGLPRLGTLM